MFVIPTHVGFTHRVVAMLVACAVMLWSVGVYTTAQAANLIEVKNTLTDSGPQARSGHLFSFEIPPGSTVVAADDYVINFDTDFVDVGDIESSDLTVRLNGGAAILIGNFSTTTSSFTFDNVVATGTDIITVEVAPGIVENPSNIQSYEFQITIANATNDSGKTRVAIVDYVTVTAEVETNFEFVVSGTGTSTAVNGTSTTGSTTATTIPFGVIEAGTVYTMAQELKVVTNAANGFVVTVEQDGNLRSANGADIDGFFDGTYLDTPDDWAPPANSLLDENTWGHWGLTSDDSDIETLSSNEFTVGGGDNWVAASTTPRIVYAHDDPVNGVGQGYGTTTVGYQLEITPLQEAAEDYQTVLMYIATPTF